MTEWTFRLGRGFKLAHHSAENALWWIYALVPIPALTELFENGALPRSAHDWLTEIVSGLIIAVLVHHVRVKHRTALTQARLDALTGLLNRHEFLNAVQSECARARRHQQPLTLAYLDLDHFKQINDEAGHRAGDRVLRQLGDAIRETVRAHVDRGFRLGGDEFALLLSGTSASDARLLLARIREQCARTDRVWVEGPLGISAGVVEFDFKESPTALIDRADAAMYATKCIRRLRYRR